MVPAPLLVFLDANVLFSRTLRDWISLSAIASGCLAYDLRCSEDVLAEWMYRMRRKRPELSEQAVGGQRRRFVEAFPHGLVTGYSPEAVPCPPDPDDRHVLAAAVHGQVDVLVTNDGRGTGAFPAHCLPDGLEVWTADELLNWVADGSMELVRRVLGIQLAYYRRTIVAADRDEAGMIAHLRKAGASRFASRLEKAVDQEGDGGIGAPPPPPP
ncbi:PIN domain-containing protein [Micromonospora cathayae]|uniref:PIN domain-containing protein n=1 Tax=Micromonospora cathayae TaxID=3028804 RepID=A0ABY7ZV61_9ACTN|nr:PIN domain-containing protein [Micromonospora sp. HUAS 3]WDZ86790.1 PIN domain-containing protein [Micromonospora sp. HUAS 3]